MNKEQEKLIQKDLDNHNKNKQFPVSFEIYVDNCKRYVKACKEHRLICSIDKVSASGMSRTLKFCELDKAKKEKRHYMLNFYMMFDVMGFQKVNHSDYFRVHGYGMDMVFNTNYNVIHTIYRYGLITKKTCDVLAQNTPHTL